MKPVASFVILAALALAACGGESEAERVQKLANQQQERLESYIELAANTDAVETAQQAAGSTCFVVGPDRSFEEVYISSSSYPRDSIVQLTALVHVQDGNRREAITNTTEILRPSEGADWFYIFATRMGMRKVKSQRHDDPVLYEPFEFRCKKK